MNNYENIYEPAEDSKLLLKCVRKYLQSQITYHTPYHNRNRLCEVGVGSGFVISNIAKDNPKFKYFGSDINLDAINFTKSEFDNLGLKIDLKNQSLLSGFMSKFDLILFNTPYFPFESKFDSFEIMNMKDRAIYGGKKGYEVISDFILEVNSNLDNDGCVFMIFSSLTKPAEIYRILKENLFEFEIIEKENSFFEKIICLKFYKSSNLKELNNLGVSNLRYLSSGKHSVVLEGVYKKKEVVVKVGLSQHLEKEGSFEERLDKESFVPKLYLKDMTFVVREKVDGMLIVDFFKSVKKKEDLVQVLNNILDSCQRLDELGINKFEMTNPYKHIFVQDDLSIKMIDFERCLFTQKAKNTTQVLQFFRRYIKVFEQKGLVLDEKKIFEVSKKYKNKNFKFNISNLM